MKLQSTPFEAIKNGSKTIETRLNDEKRQALKVGDQIEFSLTADDAQTLRTEVVGLFPYKTFSELFDAFPAQDFGGKDKADLMSIFQYYSKEDESKYGALGIKLKLIA